MLRKSIVLLLLTSRVLQFQQDDHKLEFERTELVRYDAEYVRDFKLFTYKYSRTTPVVNVTFTYTRDLGNDLQVIVQAYKFISNEYRHFPLRFQFNFCKSAAKNNFSLEGFYKCGNFSRRPVKQGRYHVCNWAPEGSRFPPRIPDGSYRVELGVRYRSAEVMVLSFPSNSLLKV